MAKSKTTSTTTASTESQDLVITITLPEATPGVGQIVVVRGDLAVVDQFMYTGIEEITAALQNNAGRLILVEENPPVVDAPKADTLKTVAGKPEPTTNTESEADPDNTDDPTDETE